MSSIADDPLISVHTAVQTLLIMIPQPRRSTAKGAALGGAFNLRQGCWEDRQPPLQEEC